MGLTSAKTERAGDATGVPLEERTGVPHLDLRTRLEALFVRCHALHEVLEAHGLVALANEQVLASTVRDATTAGRVRDVDVRLRALERLFVKRGGEPAFLTELAHALLALERDLNAALAEELAGASWQGGLSTDATHVRFTTAQDDRHLDLEESRVPFFAAPSHQAAPPETARTESEARASRKHPFPSASPVGDEERSRNFPFSTPNTGGAGDMMAALRGHGSDGVSIPSRPRQDLPLPPDLRAVVAQTLESATAWDRRFEETVVARWPDPAIQAWARHTYYPNRQLGTTVRHVAYDELRTAGFFAAEMRVRRPQGASDS